MTTVHDFEVETIDGAHVPLADYAGKTLLIVNVASRCGLTPQYAGLQKLHEQHAERGFVVLGFPCNQFLGQEPGSHEEIKSFCETKYGVSFPLFAKVEVNGEGRIPLYAHLTSSEAGPDGAGDIAWNFAKFLVDGQGQVVGRFSPKVTPEAGELVEAIERALA
ncbi:MAG: glutathione peroxidase [Myxococcales bacterium]|nr:glutathione peroxidase [Myxococcales bacterium]